MATVKVTLDMRANSRDQDGKFPLVLRIGHKSKTRDIGFDIHLFPSQFNEETGEITGILNAVRHTKRVQKKFGDVDLWIDENKAMIKLWTIAKLKDEIERQFFKKQPKLKILEHATKVFYRFASAGKYSTIESYEDALKILVKYRKKLARQDDQKTIKTLFNRDDKNGFTVKEEYAAYDMPIKAVDKEFAKDLKAYMSNRGCAINTVRIHLRSLQAITNDAVKSFYDLKGHTPFEDIKKSSIPNAPVVLSMDEINQIRNASFEEESSKFDVKNYFIFMFNNMGMNFIDVALAEVEQFDGERFSYTRNKTVEEGDYFSIKQNEENLKIIRHYIRGKKKGDYLFPIIPEGTPDDRIHRVKDDKANWFNKHMNEIAAQLGIEKNVTTYVPRDTWTNIGLDLGIDIRKISSGLGHSSIEVTEKNYSQSIQAKILDEINAQITGSPSP